MSQEAIEEHPLNYASVYGEEEDPLQAPASEDTTDENNHKSNTPNKNGICFGLLCLALLAVVGAVVGGVCGAGLCGSKRQEEERQAGTDSKNTTDDLVLVDCSTKQAPTDLTPGKFGLLIHKLPPQMNPRVLEALLKDTYNNITGMCEGLPYQRVAHSMKITGLKVRQAAWEEQFHFFLDLNITAQITCTGCDKEEPLFSSNTTSTRQLQPSALLLDQFRQQLTIEINIVLQDYESTPYYHPDHSLLLMDLNVTDILPIAVVYSVSYNTQDDSVIMQQVLEEDPSFLSSGGNLSELLGLGAYEPTQAPIEAELRNITEDLLRVDCSTMQAPTDLIPGKLGLSIHGLSPGINPYILEALLRDTYNNMTGMCEGLPYQRVAHKMTITGLSEQRAVWNDQVYSFLDLNITAHITCTGCDKEEPLFSSQERRLQELSGLLDQFRQQLTIEINLVLEDFENTPYYEPDVPLFVVDLNIVGDDIEPIQVVYSVSYNNQDDTVIVQQAIADDPVLISVGNFSDLFDFGTYQPTQAPTFLFRLLPKYASYIEDVCSEERLGSGERAACETAWEAADDCCQPFRNRNSTCFEKELAGCFSYARCHVLEGYFDAAHPDLDRICSKAQISVNPAECERACSSVQCCYTDEESCVSEYFQACLDYAPCQNLKPDSIEVAPRDLDERCDNETPSCRRDCLEGLCCSDPNSDCYRYNFVACLSYSACNGASDTQVKVAPIHSRVDPAVSVLDDICSSRGLEDFGETKCLEACAPAKCCWEKGANSCFGDDPLGCLQYQRCTILPSNSETDTLVPAPTKRPGSPTAAPTKEVRQVTIELIPFGLLYDIDQGNIPDAKHYEEVRSLVDRFIFKNWLRWDSTKDAEFISDTFSVGHMAYSRASGAFSDYSGLLVLLIDDPPSPDEIDAFLDGLFLPPYVQEFLDLLAAELPADNPFSTTVEVTKVQSSGITPTAESPAQASPTPSPTSILLDESPVSPTGMTEPGTQEAVQSFIIVQFFGQRDLVTERELREVQTTIPMIYQALQDSGYCDPLRREIVTAEMRTVDPGPTDGSFLLGFALDGTCEGEDCSDFQAFFASSDRESVPCDTNKVEGAPIIEDFEKDLSSAILMLGSAGDLMNIQASGDAVEVLQSSGTAQSPALPSPTSSPTSILFDEMLSILQQHPVLASNKALEDPSSPEYKAMSWLADADSESILPMGDLSLQNTDFLQRFALVTFYYSTGGDNWKLCGQASPSCGDVEWLTPGAHECTWFSVRCDPSSIVTELKFPRSGNDLIGELPFELSWLSALQRFEAMENALRGNLDAAFGEEISLLETLVLSNNRFTGSIPTGIVARNPKLEYLDLSGNRYGRVFPLELVMATNLAYLNLGDNDLRGTIPGQIANLSRLTTLDVQANKLSGAMPVEVFLLTELTALLVNRNSWLVGTMDTSISQLRKLQVLQLGSTSLSGTLPEELFLLTDLSMLDIQNARFTGTIPESIHQLNSSLMDLFLNGNMFTGSVPTAFDQLTALESLEIQGNQLTGSISAAVCAERGLRFQQLANLIVDCVVDCNCCDLCLESYERPSTPQPSVQPPAKAPIAPSASPFPHGIKEQLEQNFGSDYITLEPNSMEARALEWLLNKDPYQIRPDADHVIQRFVMALFYFSASQGGEWKSCGPPKEDEGDVCYHNVLVASAEEPWRYQEVYWNRWLTELHECDWAGVLCKDEKVTQISLAGYNLAGSLPTEMAKLDSLIKLELHHNSLEGSLPGLGDPGLGDMAQLETIALQSNRFTGTIPTEWSYPPTISRISLEENRLSGTIPAEFGRLSNLSILSLEENNLTGEIPDEICSLTNLDVLTADCAPIADTGTIPVICACCTNCQGSGLPPDSGNEERYGIRAVDQEWTSEAVTLKYQLSDYILDDSISYVVYDGLDCREGSNDITTSNGYLFVEFEPPRDSEPNLANQGTGTRGPFLLEVALNRGSITEAPFYAPIVGDDKARLGFCIGLSIAYNRIDGWDEIQEVNAVETAIQITLDDSGFHRILDAAVKTVVRPEFI